jgi:hypothetical protein
VSQFVVWDRPYRWRGDGASHPGRPSPPREGRRWGGGTTVSLPCREAAGTACDLSTVGCHVVQVLDLTAPIGATTNQSINKSISQWINELINQIKPNMAYRSEWVNEWMSEWATHNEWYKLKWNEWTNQNEWMKTAGQAEHEYSREL